METDAELEIKGEAAKARTVETRVGRVGRRGEGKHMEIRLEVEAGRIVGASFDTYGCRSAIQCGDATARIVTGRTLEEASRLDERDVTVLVGGLTAGKEHCAKLAIDALRLALTE